MKLGANVYRKRKSKWNIYRTQQGFVVNTGRTYRFYGMITPDRLLSIEDDGHTEIVRKVVGHH